MSDAFAKTGCADLPTALLLLRSELTTGETAQAAELVRHILAANTDNADLRVRISKVMADSSDLDDAVRQATQAVQLDPNSLEAQIALGMVSWELNDFGYNDVTLHAFAAAQRLDPNGFAGNLSLGLIESQYHRFAAADAHLHAAAAVDPSAPEPWYQLGMNAFEQDHPAEAAQALSQYLALAKSKATAKPAQLRLALLTLDQVAREQGLQPDPANATEEQALKQQIGPQADTMAFRPDAGRGVMDTAARPSTPQSGASSTLPIAATPQQLRELAANSLNAWGTDLARRHEYTAAVLPFRYAAAEDPTLDPVMRNLGFSAFMSGSYRQSQQALQQVVGAHPDDLTACAYLGMSQFELAEYADASATFQSLGPALSSKPLVEATAAAAFARAGDKARATAALNDLKEADTTPQVRAREALACLDLGDLACASTQARTALAADPQSPEALRVLGDIALENADAAAAVRAFQAESTASAQDSTESLEARALHAEALIAGGNQSAGEAIARDLLRAHPDLPKTLRDQGESLLKAGDAHGAREKLGASLALLPAQFEVRREYDTAQRIAQVAKPPLSPPTPR